MIPARARIDRQFFEDDTQAVRTPRVRRAPIRAIVVGNTSTPCSASTSLK